VAHRFQGLMIHQFNVLVYYRIKPLVVHHD